MKLSSGLLFSALSAYLLYFTPADAAEEAPRYNQINFQVERARPIDNDRMQAVLSLTAEDDSAAQLAERINRAMGMALTSAKAHAKLDVRSGNYQTYPVYNKDKIRRWRATQELILEGTDFADLSQLLGQLQENLQLSSINFSVSAARRHAVEDELISQALEAFKQRAELVRKQFVTKSYRIVNISINTSGSTPPMLMRAASMEQMTKSAAPLAVEAGTSTVTVNVSGVIELQ